MKIQQTLTLVRLAVESATFAAEDGTQTTIEKSGRVDSALDAFLGQIGDQFTLTFEEVENETPNQVQSTRRN